MAPAGNFECLMAAIEGGADSVYFGVGNLNMRSHSANNFSPEDLDEVVRMIRASRTRDEAKKSLQERFGFTDRQVGAILEMRLYQLVGLERDRLAEELASLQAAIAGFRAILADPEKVYAIIRADLADIKLKYCSKEDDHGKKIRKDCGNCIA